MTFPKAAVAAAILVVPSAAFAQEAPPTPAPDYEPPPPPPDGPHIAYVLPPAPNHAPKYSLWAGARISYVGFGFDLYRNEIGKDETTGNYLKNGLAPQIDIGARLAYRYIPYLFYEHGFMGQGHRFEGTGATVSTDFFGFGFRYLSGDIGDVDTVALLLDLSIGKRIIRISEGSQDYTMSGVEFFRVGLGAEIRLKTWLTFEPLFSISSGSLSSTSGTVNFACAGTKTRCIDGLSKPTYTHGADINTADAYIVVSIGAGLHFDLFGK